MTEDDGAASESDTLLTGARPTITVPLGVTLYGPDVADDAKLLLALGAVIRAASIADHNLRELYCALLDSPYASVTAGGAMTDWLIEEGCVPWGGVSRGPARRG